MRGKKKKYEEVEDREKYMESRIGIMSRKEKKAGKSKTEEIKKL